MTTSETWKTAGTVPRSAYESLLEDRNELAAQVSQLLAALQGAHVLILSAFTREIRDANPEWYAIENAARVAIALATTPALPGEARAAGR